MSDEVSGRGVEECGVQRHRERRIRPLIHLTCAERRSAGGQEQVRQTAGCVHVGSGRRNTLLAKRGETADVPEVKVTEGRVDEDVGEGQVAVDHSLRMQSSYRGQQLVQQGNGLQTGAWRREVKERGESLVQRNGLGVTLEGDGDLQRGLYHLEVTGEVRDETSLSEGEELTRLVRGGGEIGGRGDGNEFDAAVAVSCGHAGVGAEAISAHRQLLLRVVAQAAVHSEGDEAVSGCREKGGSGVQQVG